MEDRTVIYKYGDMELISVRHSTFSRKSFSEHMHDTFSIGLVLDGEAVVSIGDMKYNVEKDMAVIINPGQKHSCNPLSGTPWSYYMFYINDEWFGRKISEITGAEMDSPHIHISMTEDKKITGALKSLFNSIVMNCDVLDVEEKIYFCLEIILGSGCSCLENTGRSQVRTAIDFMKQRIEDNLSIDDISETAGLSPYHFLRLFRKETGITPHKYLVNLKINMSKRLMEDGVTAVDAAYRFGFADQSHFSRVFRECTGITPGQYIRSVKRISSAC